MIETNLISIVLTLYNKAPYIEETIFSIYKQTYTNWELIIVDDCSSDWSFEIAKSFCNKLWITDKCKFIQNEKNLRVAKTFERWLKEAKWDWVSMCDWDDILMKDKLKVNLSYCIKNNIDFCHSDLTTIDDNNNIINTSRVNQAHFNINEKKYNKLIYRWNATWSSIFFSKKIWSSLKKDWFPDSFAQDRRVLVYSSIKHYSIWFIKKSLIYYRRSDSSISIWFYNRKKNNKEILKWRKRIFTWEITCCSYIIEKNIFIKSEQKKRCLEHININNLFLDFLNSKNIFMNFKLIKTIFYTWEYEHWYRIFIIQARKLLTIFTKDN